ncbi:efflux RND transporter periplasmic adaptor subunit [Flavobacterium sp. RHBU_3]|uniref:efflux RND transporter periplasmic adaptor subunit n=1 Tax=Flavobacterium sp. RHBU_3 TaxID=3391184 RepID=UPI0039847025
MKNNKKILIAVVALVIVGLGLYFFVFNKKEQPVTVDTTTVKKGNISTVVTATGTIEAVKQVEVGTQVSGVVKKIYVDYNSRVKSGQLIAELDKDNLNELLDQAKAAYDVAVNDQKYKQTLYNRQKQLYQASVISQADFQEAEYNLATAKGTAIQKLSDLKKAQTNLGYANIYSPIDGVVLSRDVDEGQTVAASYSTPTLFTIAQDLKQMQVEADVDEADIGNVKQGQRVTFTVDAFQGEEFQGTVTQVRLNSTVESNVVTYTVIIKADNENEKLKPGLTATVSIYTMEVKDVLTIEGQALNFQPDSLLLQQYNAIHGITAKPVSIPKKAEGGNDTKKTVWIETPNGLEPKEVTVGRNDGINYEIQGGLIEGEKVVTHMEATVTNTSQPAGQASSPFMPKPPGSKKK